MRRTALALALIGAPFIVVAVQGVSFHAPDAERRTLASSGIERYYLLHVPKDHDRRKQVPLIISMHGAAIWPEAQRFASGWNEIADREGFIVAYPAGRRTIGPRVWRAGGGRELPVDVRFIQDLIDAVARSHNIDRTRVYANGLSNGGGMSFVLSCTIPDRIAAVGLVSSAQTWPWNACTKLQPMPMIAFHGTNDHFTPYAGGGSGVSQSPFPSIPRFASYWAERNACTSKPVETAVAPDVRRRAYANCANGAEVVLYTIEGGGHTWPGGPVMSEWFLGRTPTNISASEEMWRFFKNHRARAAQ